MTAPATADILLRVEDKQLKPELAQAKDAIQSFSSSAKKALGVVALGLASLAAVNVARDFVRLYGVQEQAEAKLAAVLKATGYAAGLSAKDMKDRAAELQKMTTVGDDVIINSQAILATFKEIKGDQFDRALVSALDLATVLDGDMKSATIQLGKALNDPIKGMAALADSGVSFTQQQKDMVKALQESGDMLGAQNIILEELASEFGGAAAAKANTFAGKLEQIGNRFTDLKEKGGGLIATVLTPLLPVLEGGITLIEALVPAAQESADAIAYLTAGFVAFLPSIDGVVEAIGTMTKYTAVAVREWRTTFGIAIASTQLAATSFALDLWHLFTDTVPTALARTGDVAYQTFTRMDEFIVTATANILQNVTDFVAAVGSALVGDGFNFEPTALLKDFRLELDSLPAYADRKLTDLERSLQRDIEGLTSDFNKALNDYGKPKQEDSPVPVPTAKPTEAGSANKEDKAKDKKDNNPTGGSEGLLNLYDRISSSASKPLEDAATSLQTAAVGLQAAAAAVGAAAPAAIKPEELKAALLPAVAAFNEGKAKDGAIGTQPLNVSVQAPQVTVNTDQSRVIGTLNDMTSSIVHSIKGIKLEPRMV